mmetsp:Transcript_47039/g.74247  ORF Transcript_47039/g.74247 Transcript_47039/m.74247 type:complete len:88 (+) Transcript_47039:70-333(+)
MMARMIESIKIIKSSTDDKSVWNTRSPSNRALTVHATLKGWSKITAKSLNKCGNIHNLTEIWLQQLRHDSYETGEYSLLICCKTSGE